MIFRVVGGERLAVESLRGIPTVPAHPGRRITRPAAAACWRSFSCLLVPDGPTKILVAQSAGWSDLRASVTSADYFSGESDRRVPSDHFFSLADGTASRALLLNFLHR